MKHTITSQKGLWRCSGHSFVNKFLKEIYIVIFIFTFDFPNFKKSLICSYFFTNFSLVLVKFVFIKKV